MSRVAPALEYFVVYNKTLQAAPSTISIDDDDAQEEAHILFYTCRPGGVKRDRMLRQIGLAKALISFSEAFTNGDGEACEMVHSARTKLVMVSPEKEYWIHACINVAYTERKNKDGTVKKEFHESSVHDIVLKTAVLRAYQEFKLLHGTFEALLNRGRSQLERQLERFFSVWAWKWDVELPAEFISHLGTPLSAYCKYLSPLIDEMQNILPEGTPVILLSSTNILASSPSPSSSLWTTLPSHLIRLVPPYESPHPGRTNSISTVKDLTKFKVSESKIVNQTNIDVLLANAGASGAHSTTSMLGLPSVKKWTGYLTFSGRSQPSAPRGALDVVSPPPPPPVPSAESKDAPVEEVARKDLPTPSRPDVDQQSLDEAMSSRQVGAPPSVNQNGSSDNETPSPPAPTSHGSLLSPALEYLNSATGGFFGAHRPKATPSDKPLDTGDVAQEVQSDNLDVLQEAGPPKSVVDIIEVGTDERGDEDTRTETSHKSSEEHTAAGQSFQETLSRAASPEPAPEEPPAQEPPAVESAPEEEGSLPSRTPSRRSSTSSSKPTVLLPPPEAFFVPISAYFEDEEARGLRLRRVYHMSLGGVMLAFVMNSPDTIQSPTDTGTLSSRRFASFGGVEILEGLGYPAYTDLPQGLEYKAVDILRKARRILDKWEDERGKDGLSPNANGSLTATPGGNGVRRFAVAGVEHGGSVLTSLGFSSTAGWLFEGQSTLRRDNSILEQFSRTTTSQSWYISKRIPHSKRGTQEREIHMEVAKKDSNLVDVDNDLATIVRRLDSASY